MADSFVGEVRTFAFGFVPYEWAECCGQQMNIQQYQALYAVIGSTYGGDNKTYFNLPNLNGRAPMGAGPGTGLTNRNMGNTPGSTTVALNANNFPPHSHSLNVVSNTAADKPDVANHYLANSPAITPRPLNVAKTYLSPATPNVQLAADAVQLAGQATGDVPHNNQQPYLPLLLCISLFGEFPVRP
jgi:microcystin-dependent protein